MPTIRVPIEVDVTQVNKTWFSGRKKNHPKHYVIGFFQRSNPGRAIIKAIADNSEETIKAAVTTHTEKGSILYAEENVLPKSLNDDYEIKEIKVSSGDLHVNNVKTMWRDLKREIKRVHVQVSQKYLQSYCNEVAWRKNHQHLSDSDKFHLALSNLLVKPRKEGASKSIVE